MKINDPLTFFRGEIVTYIKMTFQKGTHSRGMYVYTFIKEETPFPRTSYTFCIQFATQQQSSSNTFFQYILLYPCIYGHTSWTANQAHNCCRDTNDSQNCANNNDDDKARS